jgi:hypothetical protein
MGGNKQFAHDAISYERDANIYADKQTGYPYIPPPNYFDYWWNEIFGP